TRVLIRIRAQVTSGKERERIVSFIGNISPPWRLNEYNWSQTDLQSEPGNFMDAIYGLDCRAGDPGGWQPGS
ncbi:MAG: hypothetical protein ACYC6H_07760, partial [Bellilinea sp.]